MTGRAEGLQGGKAEWCEELEWEGGEILDSGISLFYFGSDGMPDDQ
jgi:hypothetical protein